MHINNNSNSIFGNECGGDDDGVAKIEIEHDFVIMPSWPNMESTRCRRRCRLTYERIRILIRCVQTL